MIDLDAFPARNLAEICPTALLAPRLQIEITETFKTERHAYVDAGFDPERIEDPLYVFDGQPQAFVVLRH